MKVLLTGHTGFLGSKIYAALTKDHEIFTLGRNKECDYQIDFSRESNALEVNEKIDVIIHAAGLAHNKAKSETELYSVNTISVKTLTEFAMKNAIERFVLISSTAVYGIENGVGINEETNLMGKSNFAKSKIEAEKILRSWEMKGQQHKALILRLPLVIGSNPPGNLGRLILSINSGKHVCLDGNNAIKSIVLASDVATLINEQLKKKIKIQGTFNLCNDYSPSFNWLENTLSTLFNKRFRFTINITLFRKFVVFLKVKLKINTPILGKLFYDLTFSDKEARQHLNFRSKPLNYQTLREELHDTYS